MRSQITLFPVRQDTMPCRPEAILVYRYWVPGVLEEGAEAKEAAARLLWHSCQRRMWVEVYLDELLEIVQDERAALDRSAQLQRNLEECKRKMQRYRQISRQTFGLSRFWTTPPHCECEPMDFDEDDEIASLAILQDDDVVVRGMQNLWRWGLVRVRHNLEGRAIVGPTRQLVELIMRGQGYVFR